MSTKTTAAKAAPKAAPAVAAPAAAPKAPKKPRTAALSAVQKFEIMALVKGADSTTPDAEIAALATAKVGRPVLVSLIARHRKAFGLASVGKPTAAALLAENAMLKAKVELLTSAANLAMAVAGHAVTAGAPNESPIPEVAPESLLTAPDIAPEAPVPDLPAE